MLLSSIEIKIDSSNEVHIGVGTELGIREGDGVGLADIVGKKDGDDVVVGRGVKDGAGDGFEVGAIGAVKVNDSLSVKTSPLATTAPLNTKEKYPWP